MYKTKVIATIGPKTCSEIYIKKLCKAGMNVARLNGSHNILNWHLQTIKKLKKIVPAIPILFDMPGKKIRTCQLKHEPRFKKNDVIILTTDTGYKGTDKVPINKDDLHLYLKKNDTIFADDGTLCFVVIKISENDIYCRAKNSGKLKSAKGINVPHVKLGKDKLSIKEKKILNFIIENKVHYVGVSFVESAKYLREIRKFSNTNNLKIIAKIENQGGLDNMNEIISETDGVMIDRGDLSTETSFENIALYQKQIIEKCNLLSKPVIVATEMLNSMIENLFPTKAEVADISNAVLDGASAIMLSGETAVGKNPLESIKVMHKICKAVEVDNNKNFSVIKDNIPSAMGKAISEICKNLPITKVIAVTMSGYAARAIASQMLRQPILAISNNLLVANSFNLYRGTEGVYVNTKFNKNNLDHVPKCIKHLWEKKMINFKDLILVTSVGYPQSGRRMNMIQTHYVKDLVKLFNWK